MIAEIMIDDLLALQIGRFTSRGAELHQLKESVSWKAGLGSDGEAFGQSQVVDAYHRIVGKLGDGTCSVVAHM
ncbi:hypothetical protein D3C86_1133510 [compost metagenome]